MDERTPIDKPVEISKLQTQPLTEEQQKARDFLAVASGDALGANFLGW